MTEGLAWSREQETFLATLLAGDRGAALRQVAVLRSQGHAVLTIVDLLLTPTQLRIGELWLADSWTVGQEHAATAISEAVLVSLAEERAETATAPAGASRVLVACVEQEWHALPALMVSEHLRADDFAVTYLGPSSSATTLVRHVHELGPVAVLTSCSLATYLPLVRRQIEAVRETGTPVVVGGSAFDPDGRRAATLGATAFSPSAEGVGDVVRSLPGSVAPAAPLDHPGAAEAYLVLGARETLSDDLRAGMIDHLLATAPGVDLTEARWLSDLEQQLPHLVGSVAGALVTDDASIVVQALSWADQLLRHRGAPADGPLALREALRETLRHLPEATAVVERAIPGPGT